MSMPRGWPLVIIIVLAILLFAAPKLPQLAKNLGQSMRIFKSEVKQMRKDDEEESPSSDRDKNGSVQAVEGTIVNDEADRQTENNKNR